MGWFTPKCPRCNGPLEVTGYSAPYPSHRCPACIAEHKLKAEVKALRERVEELEKNEKST